MIRLLALSLALTGLGWGAAQAGQSVYPVHIEHQWGTTLIIEHTPVPGTFRRKVVVRTKRVVKAAARPRAATMRKRALYKARVKRVAYRYTGIAGGCRDGGLVERRIAPTQGLILQREVCYSIAPIMPWR